MVSSSWTSTLIAIACFANAIVSSPTDGYSMKKRSACGPGQAPNGNGGCNACSPGSYSTSGASCVLAEMGSFVGKTGASASTPCLPGSYSALTGQQACIKCTVPTFSGSGAASCGSCVDGSSSSDGKNCVKCNLGRYSAGGETCLLSPIGSFVSTTGASSPTTCPGNTISNAGATTCRACPVGLFAINHATCETTPPFYNILVRDSSDTSTLGYIRKTAFYNGIFGKADIANALIIAAPDAGYTNPTNLVATTEGGTSGYNLALGLGFFGNDFESYTSSYAWLTQSAADPNIEYFAANDDWPYGKAESRVWVLGTTDSQGRVPLSLNFIGRNNQNVLCAHFFADYTDLIGASCSAKGVISEFDDHVLLYLVASA